MTRHASPVGVVVLMLAGLLASGCTAQTSALFAAVLDPATVQDDAASIDPGGGQTPLAGSPRWWPHPDGYAMALPGDWAGADLDPTSTGQLLDALSVERPGLGARLISALESTGAEVSSVAVDLGTSSTVPPMVVVLVSPTDGARARVVKARVADALAALPGLQGEPVRKDERLADAHSVRFDYTILDPDLGPLRLRSHLVRFGGQAYLVTFLAAEAAFPSAEEDFEAIASSIRFGI